LSGLTKPQVRIERIYQNLRREICLLDLPPGLVLREQDLADRFNVSRTPIRNVLGRLTADGLVESRQGVGTTVTTLDTRDVLDIYFVRATLSEAIGDSQPHPPASDTLHALEELSRRCDTLRGEAAVRRYGEINLELHSHIFSIVGNRPLREISDRLFYQTARIWFQVLPRIGWQSAVDEIKREIDEVHRAMTRLDLKAVGLVHRNYIVAVMQVIRQVLDAETDGSAQLA